MYAVFEIYCIYIFLGYKYSTCYRYQISVIFNRTSYKSTNLIFMHLSIRVEGERKERDKSL